MSSRKRRNLVGSYTIPSELLSEIRDESKEDDSVSSDELKRNLVRNDYQEQKYKRGSELGGERESYKDVLEKRSLEREERRVRQAIELVQVEPKDGDEVKRRRRKRRWDVTPEEKEAMEREVMERAMEGQLREKHGLSRNGLKVLENYQETEVVRRERDNLRDSLEVIPTYKGLHLTEDILAKILPLGYVPIYEPSVGKMHQISNDKNNELIKDLQYYQMPSSDIQSIKNKKLMEEELPTGIPEVKGLEFFKAEDMKHFGKLVKNKDNQQDKDSVVLKLLLKVKNGTPGTRKKALRQLTDNSRYFGPKLLLDHILPILLEPNTDDRERHILVKLIGRILFQLDELVRPYTHKILVVISPLLIDEDFTLRLEAREIVSGLTKAAGLANMIANLRPDLDHVDEYVRNITSRVFAVVANTLGLVNFLPFLKAVIKSKKSWTVRHTGIKIIQQLCILLGNGNGNSILPYLSQLTSVLKPGLTDEILQVRSITSLTLASLAENVKPYGIESFEDILEPAWLGLRNHRGKGLASFLKCIGSIIPLMCHDPNYEEYANYYTTELMNVIVREFSSPDEDMKRTILKISMNLPLSKDLIPNYDKTILKPFLRNFWNRRIASDSQSLNKLVVDSTVEFANKFDLLQVLDMIIEFAKDENELLRKMCIESVQRIIAYDKNKLLGLDAALEVKLIDGVLHAFQEQITQSKIYLLAFSSVAQALGSRLKPHINSIMSTVLYRLKNKSVEVRQQAADLIVIIAPVIKESFRGDEELLKKLILILYEALGEVYPEVLGSIINALNACMSSLDRETLYGLNNPSLNQILPTLTPILKNRQEKVQEACIKLVGLIAKKNAETINAKEWMRICFELLDMLKSPKKRIRVAANDTFGFIAKTIGPQDVLAMLLNNLRVQERQLRVCTAVAIGIVAETCAPFTVLPALMNEYRTPENNVQNGVLKALSFLFEYIDGITTKDYLFSITPLLEDALTDRDQVHRQTAATVVKHMAINCISLTNDDYHEVFIHFLNLLIPNIYETSPHVIARIIEAVDAIRLVLGIGTFSNYIWAGLFHPARKVRKPFWKIYNNAYIHHSDALVPYYPRLEDLDSQNPNYRIDELDLFI